MQLYDLIEFRWNASLNSFVKVQTHKTNIPSSIVYAEKKKIEFLTPKSRTTIFKIVKNGQYQYRQKF